MGKDETSKQAQRNMNNGNQKPILCKTGVAPKAICIVINRKGQDEEDLPYFLLLRPLPTKSIPDLIPEANHACWTAIPANFHRNQGMGEAVIMNMYLSECQ